MANSKHTLRTVAATVAAVVLAVATAATAAAQERTPLKSLRGELGIEKINPPPAEAKQSTLAKGGFARTFGQQPPLIPHQTEGYTITGSANACLGCHDRSLGAASAVTKRPQSHDADGAGPNANKISGQRYFCTQCHVEQTDAKPLVKNTFRNATQVK
jgi:cytochrome c-type protein NapB